DPEQREFAETIRNASDALLELINDILDFSKLEAGKVHLECITFDLRTTVEGVIQMLANQAQAKGLEIECLIHHDVPNSLRGDPGRLRQVLTNLVGNAIKFTQKGEVLVRVRFVTEEAETVVLRFEVSDTGIGIEAEKLATIFDPFTQADASTTRLYGGTGLGLSISKQIVEKMGGKIEVESLLGRGSTFSFTARFLLQDDVTWSLPNPRNDLKGVRILIVDDHETNRKILAAQVTMWSMSYEEAENGREALEMIRAAAAAGNPFEIAIIDYEMPEMDGTTLAQTIKADPAIAGIRLVMLTSIARRGQGEKARKAGISAYLTKPVRQHVLYDCLTRLLGDPVRPEMIYPPTRLITRHTLKELEAREQLRVLLVEDNAVNQKVAVRMLKKLGLRPDVASNGMEAVKAVSTCAYDLVFMDCQMPEMDGYEATA
ncbi:MAG: response regulator, partial [Deltaproteobacteria bacterium]